MLNDFFADSAGWFTLPAVVGSFVFVLRLILMLVGGAGHAGGMDVDVDVDVDAADGDAGLETGGDAHGDLHTGGAHPDPGQGMKILSIQSVAAFLMGFGWGGLGAYKGSDWSLPMAVLVGIVIGVAMMWFLAMMLKATYKLEASGNISLRDAIGLEGSVYVTIPASQEGYGQVAVIVRDHQRIYHAVTDSTDHEEIPRNAQVRIVRAVDAQTVAVVRA